MTTRFATQDEMSSWNEHILANPDGGNVFQGLEFAQQKKLGGWMPQFVMANKVALTILEKPVIGLGKLWYIPKGPGIRTTRELDELLSDLKIFAGKNNVFAIKIEPEIMKNDEALADLLKHGLKKVTPIQPNSSTVLLNLSADLETIMSHLNQKGRHAIRRAERDSVTAKPVKATDKNCQTMYGLLRDTAAGSFRIRSYNYYKTFWQHYEKSGLGQLFFAYFKDNVVAGAYAIAFGKKGTYKDGASIRDRTAYGASHLLQWHVIEWMKTKNVTVHDLCGTPPADEINNPGHPYYGIGRFKTSFNKEVTDYVGAYDIIIKPKAYAKWSKFGQKIILRLHSYLHHESYF